jgi:hypothetical protein
MNRLIVNGCIKGRVSFSGIHAYTSTKRLVFCGINILFVLGLFWCYQFVGRHFTCGALIFLKYKFEIVSLDILCVEKNGRTRAIVLYPSQKQRTTDRHNMHKKEP